MDKSRAGTRETGDRRLGRRRGACERDPDAGPFDIVGAYMLPGPASAPPVRAPALVFFGPVEAVEHLFGRCETLGRWLVDRDEGMSTPFRSRRRPASTAG